MYLVISHHESGPSIWIRSTEELANNLAVEILREKLKFLDGDDISIFHKMKDALDSNNYEAANDVWVQYQCGWADVVEKVHVKYCEVDGVKA